MAFPGYLSNEVPDLFVGPNSNDLEKVFEFYKFEKWTKGAGRGREMRPAPSPLSAHECWLFWCESPALLILQLKLRRNGASHGWSLGRGPRDLERVALRHGIRVHLFHVGDGAQRWLRRSGGDDVKVPRRRRSRWGHVHPDDVCLQQSNELAAALHLDHVRHLAAPNLHVLRLLYTSRTIRGEGDLD